jgi:hypothetical protein
MQSQLSARCASHSGGHGPAALGTAAAGFDALLHVAHALTIIGAAQADLGTVGTGTLVVRRFEQHEMGGCPAYFGTGHHQAEMLGLDMFAAHLETMRHGRSQTGLITAQAVVDAVLHVTVEMLHERVLGGECETAHSTPCSNRGFRQNVALLLTSSRLFSYDMYFVSYSIPHGVLLMTVSSGRDGAGRPAGHVLTWLWFRGASRVTLGH